MSARPFSEVLPLAATLLSYKTPQLRGEYLDADRRNRAAEGWLPSSINDLHRDVLAVVAFVLTLKENA